MSCVIGYRSGDVLYIAADSAATTEDGDIRSVKVNKIFRNGKYLIGYAGSIRAGQIFTQDCFEAPDNIKELVEAIRNKMYDYGCLVAAEAGISMSQTCFVIAYEGELYELMSDFQLNLVDEYTAIGSGTQYALAAMEVLKNEDLSPSQKLIKSLEVASRFNAGVRPPYIIEKA